MAKKEKRRIPSAAELPEKPAKSKASSSGNPIADFFASKSVRETIESVAIAFVLAFLFRTFEAEAFVIPTGSMAPTLMGEHKDLACPKCGRQYATGSSEGNVDRLGPVVGTTCPDCRYVNRFPKQDPQYPNYTGDRILVSKFIYDFHEPERWDVIVFKFPHNAKQNYIKRLVGLPHESIRVRHGDAWVLDNRPTSTQADFTIARKPPMKIRAMLQDVYDSHYLPEALAKAGWPERWQNVSGESSAAGSDGPWQPSGEVVERGESRVIERGYKLAKATAGAPAWLRYHHLPPSISDWEAIVAGKTPATPHDQLITDFYAYNAGMQTHGPWKNANYESSEALGLHWVGDLAIDADVDVQGSTGTLLLDLVEAGRRHQCAINVADGKATLSITHADGTPGQFADDDGQRQSDLIYGDTAIRGSGRYRLMFANVDNQLTLWVNDTPIEFSGPTTYAAPADEIPTWSDTDGGDLAPAGIGGDGVALEVKRLQVKRDVYYIAVTYHVASTPLVDYGDGLRSVTNRQVRNVLSNPRAMFNEERGTFNDVFAARRTVEFPLAADQFFAMGDNSPQSQDARMWDHMDRHYVERKYLLGKALFIYWPHATKLGPIPFFPNFQRMEFVR